MDLYLTGLGLTATLIVLLYLRAISRYRNVVGLDSLFLLCQWVLLIGTLALTDPNDSVETLYVELLTYFVFAFGVSGILITQQFSWSSPRAGNQFNVRPVQLFPELWLVLLLSIMVTAAYFYLVGYSAFLRGLQGLITGAEHDMATLRLSSYRGDQYLAPGYVNQFKNALLPSISVVIGHSLFSMRSPTRWLVAGGLALLSTLAMVGSAQRGSFVIFVMVLAVFLALQYRRPRWKVVVAIALAALPVLFLVTLVLGRGGETSTPSGSPNQYVAIASQLRDRVLVTNQRSGQVGFVYTYQLPTQYGADWGAGFVGLLPSRTGSTLASEIHGILHGTTRGTAPPSMVGSVHYNFGVIGVIVGPLIIAVVSLLTMHRVWSRADVNALELIGMAGVIVIGGTWVVGGPLYLLNNGLVVYIALWVAGRRIAARGQLPSRYRAPLSSAYSG